jgi:hypothetical protein
MSPHYNVVRLNTRSASAMSVCKALRYRNSIGTPNHYCTKVPLRIENPTMSKMFLEDGRELRGCRAAYLRVNSGRLSGHLAFSQSRQACSQAQSCNPTPSSPPHRVTSMQIPGQVLVPSNTKEFPHQSIIHAISLWQLHRGYDAGVCAPPPRFPEALRSFKSSWLGAGPCKTSTVTGSSTHTVQRPQLSLHGRGALSCLSGSRVLLLGTILTRQQLL